MSVWLKLSTVFLAALVLQLSLFVDVRVFGVAPELLALLATITAFFLGPDRGPLIAFGAGLLWDVFLPTPLGVAAVTFALIAFVVASLEEGLFHDSSAQLFAIVGVAGAATVITYALIGSLVGESGLIRPDILRVALLVGIINGALAPVVTPVMRWALVQDDRR